MQDPQGALMCFNPLPAFGPGDTMWLFFYLKIPGCFNPLPAFGPGDTPTVSIRTNAEFVSIRSRLLGREILATCSTILF